MGWLLYACLELISFSRSFKDKLTISSQIVLEILYNIPDLKKNLVFHLFSYVTRSLKTKFNHFETISKEINDTHLSMTV